MANCFLSDTKVNVLFPDVEHLASCLKTILKSSGTVLQNVSSPLDGLMSGRQTSFVHCTKGETEDQSGEGICHRLELLGLCCVQVDQRG